MKNMKSNLNKFLIVFLLTIPFLMAQHSDKEKISYTIAGSINAGVVDVQNEENEKPGKNRINRNHMGINLQMPIAPMFIFQQGLLCTTNIAKNTYLSLTSKYKRLNLDLPLNVVYKSLLGNGYMILGFGPNVDYPIGDKAITEEGSASPGRDPDFKTTVAMGDPLIVNYFKSFDAYDNATSAYEMASGIFCQLHTQFGMHKLNPEERPVPNQSSITNAGFALSSGYGF